MTSFLYEHVVGFEETSLVGNVYFTNYLLWQGHCRERFLHEHVPEVVERLSRHELAFFTRSCSCDYVGEWGFSALDTVHVHMTLARFRGGRMALDFCYVNAARPEAVIAQGSQEIHCKVLRGGSWIPEPFPVPLLQALEAFADNQDLRAALREAVDFHSSQADLLTPQAILMNAPR